MSWESVKQTAYSQLGVTELPPNSNNVIYNTDYYGQKVSGSSYPWCAVFLWDIFRLGDESNAFYGGQKTASCTALKNYYEKNNRYFTTGTPKIGDILIFSFKTHTDPEHCGLLVNIETLNHITYYVCIEGNTSPGEEGSQDNGGSVALKRRTKDSILGYCSIIYSDTTTSGGAVNYLESEDISDFSSRLNNQNSIFSTALVQTDVYRDSIIQVDREYNDISSQSNNLLSYPSLVEAPYINVKIGDYVFGKYDEKRVAGQLYKTYPNYITALNVVKVNGQVNMYTIQMIYQIRFGDDPNFLDKIFSSVGYGKIKISYGDYASPSFIYKEEEAIITKVSTNVDFSNSCIRYIISCTSSALSVQGTNYPFPRRFAKPSNVIKELLRNDARYHLSAVFPGLTGKNLDKNFSKFIATDDMEVEIPAQSYMDPVSYINYLVSYMIPQEDNVSSTTRSATYYMTIHDDSYADYSNVGGTYFKITKIMSTYKTLPTFNTYTVDVGYPGGDHPGENLVMNFSLKDDNSWSLLYSYAQSDIQASQENYSYSINNQGQAIQTYSPNVTLNAVHGKTTAAMKSWWTRMTEFPISATLTIKGLVRAAMLMTYLRVNTYFYGKKHVSSGLYIITRQEDTIDGSGYRTTLSLTRIAGEDEYIERKKYTQVNEVITGVNSISIPVEQKVVQYTHDEFQSEAPWEASYTINEGEKYIIPAGTQLMVLTGKDIANCPFRFHIYTNKDEYPFVKADMTQIDVYHEKWGNNIFIPVKVEYAMENEYDTYGTTGSYITELEDDAVGFYTEYDSSLGDWSMYLAVQIGNDIYLVTYEDEMGRPRQKVGSYAAGSASR